MRPVGFVALACTVVLALSGCGKDDKKPAATGPTSDPALVKFLADAGAVCTKAQADLDAIRARYANEPVAKLGEALEAASERYLQEVDDLGALKPPASVQERVQKWLVAFRAAGTKVKTLKASDAGKVDVFADSDLLAADLSLGACTSNGG